MSDNDTCLLKKGFGCERSCFQHYSDYFDFKHEDWYWRIKKKKEKKGRQKKGKNSLTQQV